MQDLSPEALRRLQDAARRQGVSTDAAMAVLRALVAGGGTLAQFSHPELGGMGQWSPGMTMIGDMFNTGLRARVEALCSELSALVREAPPEPAGASPYSAWWPAGLGAPASSGGQDGVRYAYFPASGRLAVDAGGQVSVYDTADHRIYGVSQQQGATRSLLFTSDRGTVRAEDLRLVDDPAPRPRPEPFPATAAPAGADPLSLIERLAGLHASGILNAEEYGAKKAELLARL